MWKWELVVWISQWTGVLIALHWVFHALIPPVISAIQADTKRRTSTPRSGVANTKGEVSQRSPPTQHSTCGRRWQKDVVTNANNSSVLGGSAWLNGGSQIEKSFYIPPPLIAQNQTSWEPSPSASGINIYMLHIHIYISINIHMYIWKKHLQEQQKGTWDIFFWDSWLIALKILKLNWCQSFLLTHGWSLSPQGVDPLNLNWLKTK